MRLSPSIAILRTQSDERLVALARGGSEAAFAAIVERYRGVLQRACRRVLSESRAEDAVQQAFLSAWMALERGDAVVHLRGWLLKIARNTSLNALRAPGYDYAELHDSLCVGAAPQDELERREVMRQTLTGLAALPERQREALLRSAVAGVSYAQIAHDLGVSEGATRQLILRARTAMRGAATALTPWPLAQWIAFSGRGEVALRVTETAGGGGLAALLAKAGVVVVVAGGAAAGPALVRPAADLSPRASAASRPATPWAATATSAAPSVVATAAPASAGTSAKVAQRRHDDDRDRADADDRDRDTREDEDGAAQAGGGEFDDHGSAASGEPDDDGRDGGDSPPGASRPAYAPPSEPGGGGTGTPGDSGVGSDGGPFAGDDDSARFVVDEPDG